MNIFFVVATIVVYSTCISEAFDRDNLARHLMTYCENRNSGGTVTNNDNLDGEVGSYYLIAVKAGATIANITDNNIVRIVEISNFGGSSDITEPVDGADKSVKYIRHNGFHSKEADALYEVARDYFFRVVELELDHKIASVQTAFLVQEASGQIRGAYAGVAFFAHKSTVNSENEIIMDGKFNVIERLTLQFQDQTN